MASPDAMSLRAFARLLDVSDYAVRKAVASKRIPPACVGQDERGRPVIVDVESARVGWVEKAAKPTKTNQTNGLADEQRALSIERRRQIRLQNDAREGLLIDRNTVVKERFEQGRLTRERVLNVTPRIAPALAAETDVAKVAAMLDAELRAALDALADELGKAGA